MLRRILSLLSFLTILPLKIDCDISEIAEYTHLFPIIGVFIGLLAGVFGILLDMIRLPHIIVASLVYSFLIWFTGFNHLDGLVDMGDALMTHGSPQEKIKAMKDERIGTGGLGLLVIVALTTFTVIFSIPESHLLAMIILGEVGAKMGLVSSCIISRPLDTGIGRYFVMSVDKKRFILSFFISFIIGFALFKFVGVIGITGGVVGGLFIGAVARKNFKWATGDVLGASNEFNRMITLITLLLALQWVG